MVRVKICGITSLDDALAAIDAGCDALGFVFYKKSPRYIAPSKAKEIIRGLRRDILKIGVFVNEKEKEIRRVAELCGLDMLQLHGDESAQFCARLKDYKIIKAFRVGSRLDAKDLSGYKPFAYLFDTFSRLKAGGTGRKFDWGLLKGIGCLKRPVFLSGGLSTRNILEAIKRVHPQWIDVSSSVEIRPGKKDRRKLRILIRLAKNKKNYHGKN